MVKFLCGFRIEEYLDLEFFIMGFFREVMLLGLVYFIFNDSVFFWRINFFIL